MRKKHCAFARLNNGRCIAPCSYTRDQTVPGDCTGNESQIMRPDREAPVNMGFLDGRGVALDTAGYRIIPTKAYKPDVNKDCKWGKSSDTQKKLNAFNLKGNAYP